MAGAKDQHTQHDHIGEDEVTELQMSPSFYQKVREQAERFASIRLGQFVIERADRALKLIEDTSKWSLPQEKSSNAVVLERPLPWVPFLMMIILLRLARVWLSLGALMIGNGPVSPADMLSFIRTRRRKLRAIRLHGLREMRHRQLESISNADKSFIQQLSQWLSRAICRPGVQRENNGRLLNMHSKEQQQSPSVVKSPRAEKLEADQNLTFHEMMSKYVNENSEDDSDYVPNKDESESSSSSNSSSSSSESSEEIIDDEAENQAKQVHNAIHVAVNNKESYVEKERKLEQEQDKEREKLVKTTTTSNGNNDKEQKEVAKRAITIQKEEEWKSSPGHLSAAIVNTRLYNNTAAAGSPNNFNTFFGTPPSLRDVTINSVPTHSTPNSEQEDPHSAGSELEEAARQSISLAHQAEQHATPTAPVTPAAPAAPSAPSTYKQQQQQQRQLNQSHQRYRGRNRR